MNLRKRNSVETLLLYLVWLLLAAAFFYFVLVLRESSLIKTLGVLGRYNLTRFLPILGLLLYISFLFKRVRVSNTYLWAVILAAYALALIGLWASAYSENYVIAGLIPRSDAFYNYSGSLYFWLRGRLIGFASRRPLFGSFLALLLWVFNGDLQIVLTLFSFISAVIALAAFIQARAKLHPLGAILFFMVIFLFMRRFTGLTMSEILGCLLGTAALAIWLYALVLNGQNERASLKWFLAGTFVYMLAQMSRPADVGSLPLLVLFTGWVWRGERKFSWHAAGFTIGVLAMGFFFNLLIYSLFSTQDSALMNNFGYGIYGLASGGLGWKQIFFDYPELYGMPAGIREQAITRIILDQLASHPGQYIKGLAMQSRILFSFSETNSLFSFITGTNTLANYALMGGLTFLLVVGVFFAVLRRKDPIYLLLILLLSGFLLSLSVSPAYQTQYMRVFAASIPALAFGAGAGLSCIMDLLRKRVPLLSKIPLHAQDALYLAVPLSGVSLAGLVVLAPFLVRLASPMLEPVAGFCAEGQSEIVFRSLPATRVSIFKNTPDRMTWVPYVSRFDYQRDIHSICCADDIAYFSSFLGGTELFPTVNLLDGNNLLVVAPDGTLPPPGELVRSCGRIEDIYHNESNKGFFYPDYLEIIQH